MCIALTVVATLTVTALFLTTLLHAAVHHDLFPNDISIAITERRPKHTIADLNELHGSKAAADAAACRDLEAAATLAS
jgi:hypothetical protein